MKRTNVCMFIFISLLLIGCTPKQQEKQLSVRGQIVEYANSNFSSLPTVENNGMKWKYNYSNNSVTSVTGSKFSGRKNNYDYGDAFFTVCNRIDRLLNKLSTKMDLVMYTDYQTNEEMFAERSKVGMIPMKVINWGYSYGWETPGYDVLAFLTEDRKEVRLVILEK